MLQMHSRYSWCPDTAQKHSVSCKLQAVLAVQVGQTHQERAALSSWNAHLVSRAQGCCISRGWRAGEQRRGGLECSLQGSAEPGPQNKFILTIPTASCPYCSSICCMPLGTCFCREFWPSVWCRSGKSHPSSDEENRSPLAGE